MAPPRRWRRAGCALLLALAAPFASAQLSTRGEIGVVADLTLLSRGPLLRDAVGLTLRGHLELGYALSPFAPQLELRATLDPTLRVTGGAPDEVRFEPGLTEAVAQLRLDAADVELGLLRRPLETARLSVPFRIEPVNAAGQPEGLLGAAASVYLDRWRIRPAALYRHQDDTLGGGVSVRREFDGFDLEAHLIYLGDVAAGLGGSGLVGEIVVYGEGWLLTEPWDGRGALGLSGFAGEVLWTAELAYAPFQPGAAEALAQLLGQASVPLGDAVGLEIDAGLGLLPASDAVPEGALRGRGGVRLSHTESDYRTSLGVAVGHSEVATSYALQLAVTAFY